MVMIYSLLGCRAACWAGIDQRVLHHWLGGGCLPRTPQWVLRLTSCKVQGLCW